MLAIGLGLEVVERDLRHAFLEVGSHAGKNLGQDAHGSSLVDIGSLPSNCFKSRPRGMHALKGCRNGWRVTTVWA